MCQGSQRRSSLTAFIVPSGHASHPLAPFPSLPQLTPGPSSPRFSPFPAFRSPPRQSPTLKPWRHQMQQIFLPKGRVCSIRRLHGMHFSPPAIAHISGWLIWQNSSFTLNSYHVCSLPPQGPDDSGRCGHVGSDPLTGHSHAF